MRAEKTLTFNVVSFRNLETPFVKQGYKDYFAVVQAAELPDLSGCDKSTFGPQTYGCGSPAIRESLHEQPRCSVHEQGIVLSWIRVFDNRASKLTLSSQIQAPRATRRRPYLQYSHEELKALPGPQFIKIEVLEILFRGYNTSS